MVDLANLYKNTALHSAVLAGNLEVVKYLIDSAKAKIEPGFEGHTLLTEALIMGHKKILNYLLEKQVVDVNAIINKGQTLLHLATFRNDTGLVKRLVRKHQAYPGIADGSNIEPVILAVYKGNLELVEFFLERGLDCTSALLATAASEGHYHIIEYMIRKHKIPIELQVFEGKTMLDIAIIKRQRDVIKFLLQNGEEKFDIEFILFIAMNNIYLLKFADYVGSDTFEAGDKYPYSEFIFGSLDKRRIMDELLFILNNSAIIHGETRTSDGLNLLQYAAMRGNLPVIKAIIQRNLIQVFFTNSKLHNLIIKYQVLIGCESLICCNIYFFPQVDSKTEFGQTALSIAAEKQYFEIVQYLVLEGNATLNDRDIEGMTELHRAVTGLSVAEQRDYLDLDFDWNRHPTSRKYKLCTGDEFSFDDFGRRHYEQDKNSESALKFFQKFVLFPSPVMTSAKRYGFTL